jgi:hypothetical protein
MCLDVFVSGVDDVRMEPAESALWGDSVIASDPYPSDPGLGAPICAGMGGTQGKTARFVGPIHQAIGVGNSLFEPEISRLLVNNRQIWLDATSSVNRHVGVTASLR